MAELSRRLFIGTGVTALAGLAVGTAWLARQDLAGTRSRGTHGTAQRLNAFIEVLPDGQVRALVPRAEMGQGAQMGLATLIAEELDLPLARVLVEHPSELLPAYINTLLALARRPEEIAGPLQWTAQRVFSTFPYIGTGGSTTLADAWVPVRTAAAVARQMLLQAAAARFGVAATELSFAEGAVVHAASQRRAHYGELAAAAAALEPPAAPTLKPAAQWQLIGHEGQRRVDLPAKVTGAAVFGVDVRLPGLRVGTLMQAPRLGAQLLAVDDSAVAGLPGQVQIVKGRDFVAAVATSYWFAKQALAALKTEWTVGSTIDDSDVQRALAAAAAGQAGAPHDFRNEGQAAPVIAGARRTLRARYEVPYLAHLCMEPMNATAWLKDDGSLEVWAPIQSPTAMMFAAQKVLGSAPAKAQYHTTMLGGGFGRRGERDYVERAIEVAAALKGTPVKLIWSREEDVRHDMYRPAAMAELGGAIDDAGRLLALEARVAVQSVAADFARRNLPYPMSAARDPMNVEGLENIPYALPHVQVSSRAVELQVPVGNWRSVGNSQNGFFAEGFIDELAHLAGADPLQFRRQHLRHHPRWLALLDKLQQVSGWGTPLPAGHGRGIALVESFRSLVGEVAEVRLHDGRLKVERVHCVVDCGVVVNPDVVRAQVQSGVVYGLSAALLGKLTLRDGAVLQGNFHDQPVLRLAQAPRIDVHLIASSAPPGGIGEPGTPPIAAAVVNALFAASGKRYRSLPLVDHGLVV